MTVSVHKIPSNERQRVMSFYARDLLPRRWLLKASIFRVVGGWGVSSSANNRFIN